MSGYEIKPRQFKNAKTIGVTIKSSKSKNKKIDIFNKENKKIGSIGGVRSSKTLIKNDEAGKNRFYGDYATYLDTIGKEKANIKKTAYLARHAKEPKMKDGKRTNSYYSDIILWS